MTDDALRQARAALESLEALTRELIERRPGGHLIEQRIDGWVLEVALSLREEGRDERAAELRRQIDELLDEAVQHAAVFRPGHAYCHRCASAACEHSLPPSSRHVFSGYAPTGAPRWVDFAQRCLDLRHPDVDRLYDQPPAFIAVVDGAEALHRGLLGAYDGRKVRLLGQVSAGFWAVPARADEGRAVVAVTVQALLSRAERGRPRVGLNLLALAPDGEPVETVWERQDDLPWRRSIRWAQAAVATLRPPASRKARRAGAADAEMEKRVDGILQGLRRRLERDHRARGRRTRHAEERHRSGRRPTRKAIEDARAAPDEAFMHDARSGVVVVLGDRGRTHFFGPDGRLVSSVRYSRDAISRKIERERWNQATDEQRETLRRSLSDSS